MLIDVYPRKRLPRTLGPFTYRLPDGMAEAAALPGSWVRIPFRGKTIDGIVWNRRTTAPKGVTRIADVQEVLGVPRVTQAQRALAEFLAQETAVSLSVALEAMLPERARRPGTGQAMPTQTEQVHYRITRERQRRIEMLLASESQKRTPVFLPLGPIAERLAFLLTLLSHAKSTQQILVVAPTYEEVLRLSGVLSTRFPGRVFLLSSELSRTALWRSWTAAAERRDGIFLTTKIGLFAPYAALGTTVLDLESDPNHKQSDQNPRYHARTILLKLAALHKASCFLLDAQPSLSTWVNPSVRREPLPPRAQDRRVARIGPHTTVAPLVTTDAEQLLQHTKGTVLVFLNRKGASRSLVCRDCGWQFHCTNCRVALGDDLGNDPHCVRCGAAAILPQLCPSCGGARLIGQGIGVDRLAQTLRSLAPQRRVVPIEGTDVRPIVAGDIVVATEKILQLSPLPVFDAILIANVDGILRYPDFATVERGYLLLERLCSLARNAATVLVQTFDTEQPVIAAFRSQQPDALYQQELALRAKLLLPPARRVLVLIGSGSSESAIEHEAQRLVQTLNTHGANHWSVEGPWLPRSATNARRHQRIVVVHLLSGADFPDTLRTELASLSDAWLVDSQPESLYS